VDEYRHLVQPLDHFFVGFLSVSGAFKDSSSERPSFFDKYLRDPYLRGATFANMRVTISVNGVSIPPPSREDYSDRMGQLINSYLFCMNSMHTLTGGISEETAIFWDSNATTFIPPLKPGTNATTREWGESYNWTSNNKQKSRIWPANGGSQTIHREVIVAHKPWVFALAGASMVLMLASVASPLIRGLFIHGPELAMNFSSLATRDNPHVLLPENGTFLDAADRARLVKNIKVQFGDVHVHVPAGGGGGGENQMQIGKLAISSTLCGDDRRKGDLGVLRLRKGRLYM